MSVEDGKEKLKNDDNDNDNDNFNCFELSKRIETSQFMKKFLARYILKNYAYNSKNMSHSSHKVIFVITKGSTQVDVDNNYNNNNYNNNNINFSLYWELKLEEAVTEKAMSQADHNVDTLENNDNITKVSSLDQDQVCTHYISISGNILKWSQESFSFEIEGRVLEESSARNLLEVLSAEAEEESESESAKNEHESDSYKSHSSACDLIDSLCRQARIFLQEKYDKKESESESSSFSNVKLQVYFQNSLVIDKREYPLFFLEQQANDNGASVNFILSEDVRNQLESSELTIEEKENLVKNSFYLRHPEIPFETLEQTLFSSITTYEKLMEDLDHSDSDSKDHESKRIGIKEKIEKLSKSSIKLSDLQGAADTKSSTENTMTLSNATTDNTAEISIDSYDAVMDALIEPIFCTRIPHQKCAHLLRFYGHVCEKMSQSGGESSADFLLPLITFSVIKMSRGAELRQQVRFIERFLHPAASTGLFQYVLTNLSAAFEIILQIYSEKFGFDKEIYKLAALMDETESGDHRECEDKKIRVVERVERVEKVEDKVLGIAVQMQQPIIIQSQSHIQSSETATTATTTTTTGHFVNIISSIGQVPKAIGAAVVSGFKRSDALHVGVNVNTTQDKIIASTINSPGQGQILNLSLPRSHGLDSGNDTNKYNPDDPEDHNTRTAISLLNSSPDLARFRERILATNSANDLVIRDLNPLLEDYKNLLFILFKL